MGGLLPLWAASSPIIRGPLTEQQLSSEEPGLHWNEISIIVDERTPSIGEVSASNCKQAIAWHDTTRHKNEMRRSFRHSVVVDAIP